MSAPVLALGTLCASFAVMLMGQRLRLGLWLCVLAGSVCLTLLTGTPVADFVGVVPTTFLDRNLLALLGILCLILALSGVQEASGQSLRMVAALERILHSPRLRLTVFPALVGLLPMPGGALFSCPMLESAARRMHLDPKRKTAINYWFRHVWEPAWPLYPGYILACALLGLPLSGLLAYTFPLVIVALAAGWFFLLRDLPPEDEDDAPAPDRAARRKALLAVFYESLPITAALLGAIPAALMVEAFFPDLPSGSSFLISLAAGVLIALAQDRRLATLKAVVPNRKTGTLLLLIFMIFVFKTTLERCGLITELAGLGADKLAVLALCIFLPFICGGLTGLMAGYVGAIFPILAGLFAQTGMAEQAMPLYVLAIAAGYAGEMLSPLHVCLVLSCDYFKVGAASTIRLILPPVLLLFFLSTAWCLFLAMR